MAKCRSCGAEILFIKTAGGKMTPVNAEPVRFNYQLGAKGRVVTGNGEVLPADIREDGEERGWISHFSTCPDADKFRKGKR